ncbi:MAG: sn-glycerol-3-phosphate ABC transporter ATP-binding protein UgpC [Gemmatimonadales bacterium]|nr:sn-glycerol-3-phosphate ABC transporter ATP-binding protein UgpC [Gemmatimonadales bacterium]MBA3554923.1 sn-glycerol-3-phosphate ABC transporter ATP-binding protein UgpC [Gemmatimonadales bacterium]
MASVKLVGVRKIYDEGARKHPAVQDLDLEIADGELMVLVGPSGCGKSTTLRMIAGLESVSRGQLEIGGRVVTEVPAKDRDIAMVFQNYALYPHMTAYQNMAFALTLRRMAKPEIEGRVRDAARVLGIEALLGRRPRQLSGGERQRVALGRALVRKPQVFLFDEPLSNLDAKLRVQMRREIARLHRQLKTTMIYVTHDQVEAMTLGDRIAVLHRGELQQVDTPAALYERPRNAFVASFIGTPPMNLVEGEIAHGSRFRARGGAFTVDLGPRWAEPLTGRDGQAVILGIRPEDCRVADEAAGGSETALVARVDLVELLGGEALVHLAAGAIELTARVSPPVPAAEAELRLILPPERIHLFDTATGARMADPSLRSG